ncbi:cAMP-dependent protein kinase inhibitor alpha-like [Aethina tumida]|uniref:cAMP-dependent protein kinase inhibitor alpha-like n=1 Tax=Aethina tumida TaxID=116153 RepID=UPI0021489555|nr:cAMP-dependent protein kinase inhibitor alpha-like [Aethina tumida]
MAQRGLKGVKPDSNGHVIKVRKNKLTRKSVLKMLAVMEAQSANSSNSASNAPPTPDSTTHAQEFMSTGRTGRRNALPDILCQHSIQVTSSDLPSKLQALSTTDNSNEDPHNKQGTSNS